MCLIALLFRSHPEAPVALGANRDEFLDRPSIPMGVLRAGTPRLLGGQDARAGGTWLAIGEHGVVAGLTNRPQPHGSDPHKRSRGQLPLLMAGMPTAHAAAEAMAALDPASFNPCYLLVADRHDAFYFDFAGGDATPRALNPGLIVLENRPLDAPSAKVQAIKKALSRVTAEPLATLAEPFMAALRSHEVPAEPPNLEPWRPPPTRAPCVHAGPYGTRSSTVVVVPYSPLQSPRVYGTDQAPCRAPYTEHTELWRS